MVARAIPAQVACRILGNPEKPCQLDPLCKPSEKFGVWLFYSAFALAAGSIFFLIFWILRITRIEKLIGFFARLVIPPIKWLANIASGMINFYKNLPF